jgi:hypothetical protein
VVKVEGGSKSTAPPDSGITGGNSTIIEVSGTEKRWIKVNPNFNLKKIPKTKELIEGYDPLV